jgi:tetratricopeptide (TPR) repeat protein
VKVSTRLTDVRSGRQIWSDAFDHPLEASSLIATQEEIARSVIAAIGSEYGIISRRLAAESRKKPPAELDTYEAMLCYYSHQTDPSPESASECFPALQQAVEREPDYGPAWSALATLFCQAYSMDTPGFDQPLDTALRYARRGVSLDPGSQLGRLILAYASYVADDSESFHQEIETAMALNPNSPYAMGAAGCFYVMRGEIDRGLPLLNKAVSLNPCHPSWFHVGYTVDHLRRKDYEGALRELQGKKPLQSFFLPASCGAILGKLGRRDEARGYLQQVEQQKPDFATRVYELYRRILKIDTLIDDLLDGLRRAGMRVGQSGKSAVGEK